MTSKPRINNTEFFEMLRYLCYNTEKECYLAQPNLLPETAHETGGIGPLDSPVNLGQQEVPDSDHDWGKVISLTIWLGSLASWLRPSGQCPGPNNYDLIQ